MASQQVHTFHVAMTCDGCSNAVRKVLGKLGDKVSNVEIDMPSQTVRVTSSLSHQELLESLKKTGKETTYDSSTLASSYTVYTMQTSGGDTNNVSGTGYVDELSSCSGWLLPAVDCGDLGRVQIDAGTLLNGRHVNVSIGFDKVLRRNQKVRFAAVKRGDVFFCTQLWTNQGAISPYWESKLLNTNYSDTVEDIGVVSFCDFKNGGGFLHTTQLKKVYFDVRALEYNMKKSQRVDKGTLVQIRAIKDNQNPLKTEYVALEIVRLEPPDYAYWQIQQCEAKVHYISVDGSHGYLKPIQTPGGPLFKARDMIFFSFWAASPLRLFDAKVQIALKDCAVKCLVVPEPVRMGAQWNTLPWKAIKFVAVEKPPQSQVLHPVDPRLGAEVKMSNPLGEGESVDEWTSLFSLSLEDESKTEVCSAATTAAVPSTVFSALCASQFTMPPSGAAAIANHDEDGNDIFFDVEDRDEWISGGTVELEKADLLGRVNKGK